MGETTDRGALGTAKALDHIGEVEKRKEEGRKPPLALCTRCGAPVIATMAFPRYEFYCLECGHHLGFLDPRRGDGDDPALQKRYDNLKAEWDEHVGGKLMPRGTFWRDGCSGCKTADGKRLGHLEHATDEERTADEAARNWLKERAAA